MIPKSSPSSDTLHFCYPKISDSGKKCHYTVLMVSVMLLSSMVGGALKLSSTETIRAAADSAILTYKGDNYRTGQNPNETILNRSDVTVSQFGKRMTYPVDGQVYAQPLFIPNLLIHGAMHNVVFAETEHDSIYAFDADRRTASPPLWHTSLLTNGATAVSTADIPCSAAISPEIGITSTPVIDRYSNILYVVAYTKEKGNLIYRLHAINILTGREEPGSPTVIQGSVPGGGAGSVNGNIAFNPKYQLQRAALLLVNRQIYVAFASFCDAGPYHGWIMSYSYNLLQFYQTGIYNDTPDGGAGGIWNSGNGLAADDSGNIYTVSGNGDFNLNTGGRNAGDTIIKLSPQLQVLDYFTPFNQLCLQRTDFDLGSGGPLLIPSTNEQIGVGKEGRIYVVNDLDLGKFTPDPQLNCLTNEQARTDIDHVIQELPPQSVGDIFGTPIYWNNTVYFSGINDRIKAFCFSNGRLSTSPISQTVVNFPFSGGNAMLSSNGNNSSTGILWVIDPNAVLRAYDATNLSNELYDSQINPGRDALDSWVKFTVPTVANGEVFVGTKKSLTIYGLLATPCDHEE